MPFNNLRDTLWTAKGGLSKKESHLRESTYLSNDDSINPSYHFGNGEGSMAKLGETDTRANLRSTYYPQIDGGRRFDNDPSQVYRESYVYENPTQEKPKDNYRNNKLTQQGYSNLPSNFGRSAYYDSGQKNNGFQSENDADNAPAKTEWQKNNVENGNQTEEKLFSNLHERKTIDFGGRYKEDYDTVDSMSDANSIGWRTMALKINHNLFFKPGTNPDYQKSDIKHNWNDSSNANCLTRVKYSVVAVVLVAIIVAIPLAIVLHYKGTKEKLAGPTTGKVIWIVETEMKMKLNGNYTAEFGNSSSLKITNFTEQFKPSVIESLNLNPNTSHLSYSINVTDIQPGSIIVNFVITTRSTTKQDGVSVSQVLKHAILEKRKVFNFEIQLLVTLSIKENGLIIEATTSQLPTTALEQKTSAVKTTAASTLEHSTTGSDMTTELVTTVKESTAEASTTVTKATSMKITTEASMTDITTEKNIISDITTQLTTAEKSKEDESNLSTTTTQAMDVTTLTSTDDITTEMDITSENLTPTSEMTPQFASTPETTAEMTAQFTSTTNESNQSTSTIKATSVKITTEESMTDNSTEKNIISEKSTPLSDITTQFTTTAETSTADRSNLSTTTTKAMNVTTSTSMADITTGKDIISENTTPFSETISEFASTTDESNQSRTTTKATSVKITSITDITTEKNIISENSTSVTDMTIKFSQISTTDALNQPTSPTKPKLTYETKSLTSTTTSLYQNKTDKTTNNYFSTFTKSGGISTVPFVLSTTAITTSKETTAEYVKSSQIATIYTVEQGSTEATKNIPSTAQLTSRQNDFTTAENLTPAPPLSTTNTDITGTQFTTKSFPPPPETNSESTFLTVSTSSINQKTTSTETSPFTTQAVKTSESFDIKTIELTTSKQKSTTNRTDDKTTNDKATKLLSTTQHTTNFNDDFTTNEKASSTSFLNTTELENFMSTENVTLPMDITSGSQTTEETLTTENFSQSTTSANIQMSRFLCESATVRLGTEAHTFCLSESEILKFNISNQTMDVTNAQRHRSSLNNSNITLHITILNTECSDSGMYTVEIETKEGNFQTNFFIIVQGENDSPILSLNPDQIADLGFYREDRKHFCSSDLGYPAGNLTIVYRPKNESHFKSFPENRIEYFIQNNMTQTCIENTFFEFGINFKSEDDLAEIKCVLTLASGDIHVSQTQTLTLIPNNTCNGSDHYSHPHSCSKYVDCINKFPYGQECQPGLCFDRKTKKCDYCYQVDCEIETTSIPMSSTSASNVNQNISLTCNSVIAQLNSDINFTCFVNGSFNQIILTHKSNGILTISADGTINKTTDDERYSAVYSNGTIIVSITSIVCNDSGFFKVDVYDNLSAYSSKSSLQIKGVPSVPELTLNPDQISGPGNFRESSKHTCSAVLGYPPGNLTILYKPVNKSFTAIPQTKFVSMSISHENNNECTEKEIIGFGIDFDMDSDNLAEVKCVLNLPNGDTKESRIDHFDIISDDFCNESGFYPNPTNCNKYIQCDDKLEYGFNCPGSTCFGVNSTVCTYSSCNSCNN